KRVAASRAQQAADGLGKKPASAVIDAAHGGPNNVFVRQCHADAAVAFKYGQTFERPSNDLVGIGNGAGRLARAEKSVQSEQIDVLGWPPMPVGHLRYLPAQATEPTFYWAFAYA